MIESVSLGALVALAALVFYLLRGRADGRDAPVPESVPPAVAQWAPVVQREAERVGFPLDWRWGLAMLWQESAGDPRAVGTAGEVGLMQMTRGALQDAKSIIDEPMPALEKLTADQQIRAGLAYATKLQDYGASGPEEIIRAYNEGPPPLSNPKSKEHFERVEEKWARLK